MIIYLKTLQAVRVMIEMVNHEFSPWRSGFNSR